MFYGARTDTSQRPIVEALRSIGADVEIIGGHIDLIVAFQGRVYLVDCKTRRYKTGKKCPPRTAHQIKYAARLERVGCALHFWETPQQALAALGCTV